MPPDSQGKLVIRAISDDQVARKVTAFICTHVAGATPDRVSARLCSLPLVLSSSIPAASGLRTAKALQDLGADALFIPHEEVTSATPAADPPMPPPPPRVSPRPVPTSQPQPREGKRVVGGEGPPDVAGARTLAVYALLACLVSMVSPVFYLVSLPLSLYAVHRACGSLHVSEFIRSLYLVGVFIPFANVLFLLLLSFQGTLALRELKPPFGVQAAFGIPGQLGLASLMTLALLGVGTGILPESFSSLAESVERQLQREVARSAKQYPLKVNNNLQIDNVTAGPDKLLTFNCTLLKSPASGVDPVRFRDSVRGSVAKEVCSSGGLKQYLERGVAIDYTFKGSDGNHITTVTVTVSDCSSEPSPPNREAP